MEVVKIQWIDSCASNMNMNGLWYCGYNNSVFHTSDRDLSIALDMLRINLKLQGYVD